MKAKPEPEAILKQIAEIQDMERGKLCRMRARPTGDYYNHQTWEKGRNVVRYVPREHVENLQRAIAGYQHYLQLTNAYADEVIRRSRLKRTSESPRVAAKKSKTVPKSH